MQSKAKKVFARVLWCANGGPTRFENSVRDAQPELFLMGHVRSLRLIDRALLYTCTRLRARSYCSMTVHSEITPNERETKLFKILTSTLEHSNLDTTLRCAGGWVRDKLLGLESDDIDIAIDNMLGKEFAEHVNRYLESQNMDMHKVKRTFFASRWLFQAWLLKGALCNSHS